MAFLWREHVKKVTTPHQRHQLIMLRERIVWPYTRATARWRTLPDFIIIGAPRSGTTHLFNTLRHHPQVRPARMKEVKYFIDERKYQKGEMKYRSYFPFRWRVKEGDVVGEASPNYFSHPEAAKRIHNLLPDVKLILMLRDPVEQFLSIIAYRNMKAAYDNHQPESLSEAVRSLEEHPERVEEMAYITKLKRYDEYYKRGLLRIYKSGDYFNNSSMVLRDICSYLNIEEVAPFPKLKARNASPRNGEPNEYRERLAHLFAPYNEALYQYIGRDMEW